jgi:molecular chaperone GrpE
MNRPPDDGGSGDGDGEGVEDEALLSRFREWLREVRAGGDADEAPPPVAEGPEVGLYQIAEEFTALRQEVKLQTKSSRGLQDEAEALLPALRQAIEQFRSVAPKEEHAALSAARPFAEAIADLDEALERGRLGVEKARQNLVDPLDLAAAALDLLYQRQPWHRRLRFRRYHNEARALLDRQDRSTASGLFDALVEGFGLIQARLRRTMEAEQVKRIECVGRPVDPERMTVIGLVDASEQPPGHVADEVRRGYTWRDRVLRFAEVRAARPRPSDNDEDEHEVEDEDEDETDSNDEGEE